MLVTVNEGTFLLCITSPKDEYQIFSFFGQDTDGSICKLFPTATLVRTGLVGAYCQGGVQQQDTLFGGSYAQKKGAFIDRNKHLVLSSAHPSPLSAYNGFFGNKHFSKTNEYLKAHGKTEINW